MMLVAILTLVALSALTYIVSSFMATMTCSLICIICTIRTKILTSVLEKRIRLLSKKHYWLSLFLHPQLSSVSIFWQIFVENNHTFLDLLRDTYLQEFRAFCYNHHLSHVVHDYEVIPRNLRGTTM